MVRGTSFCALLAQSIVGWNVVMELDQLGTAVSQSPFLGEHKAFFIHFICQDWTVAKRSNVVE